MLIAGIEEAGRGAVIGPLVVAGAVFEEKDIESLKSLGVRDSKLLKPLRREALFGAIIKTAKRYLIIKISPHEIDNSLNSGVNLNELEGLKFVELVNKLNPDTAIIDCPSNNIHAFKSYLFERIKNKKMQLKVEHKADVRYLIVGAASILAKVSRDREIKTIEKAIGQSVGTGYPSNTICQKFLKENWNKYDIFRKTWASYKRVVGTEKQTKLI